MRYGIFSDVHGNIESLEASLAAYESEGIDKYIFLGDVVGYGANPAECICMLRARNPVCIAGNHDWAAVSRLPTDYFNDQARAAIVWTRARLNAVDIGYISSFGLCHEEIDFVCVHGSPDNPQVFNYILDEHDAERNFSCFGKKLCFIGHSHRMETYILEKNTVSRLGDYTISLNPDNRYIVNVGSVGQPRDRDPRACICIYDDENKSLTFRRNNYDINSAAEKILKEGLPVILAERLYGGY
jgi:diadenosine tetraphosphatase ApaH/serine/threonine PP2A family protein phosphatase